MHLICLFGASRSNAQAKTRNPDTFHKRDMDYYSFKDLDRTIDKLLMIVLYQREMKSCTLIASIITSTEMFGKGHAKENIMIKRTQRIQTQLFGYDGI